MRTAQDQRRDPQGRFAPGSYAESDVELEAELAGHVHRSARRQAARRPVDADDLTQDTFEAMLRVSGNEPGLSGFARQVDNPSAWIGRVSHNLAVKQTLGLEQGKDRAAFKQWLQARETFAATNQRFPTSGEEDQIADRIVASKPPRFRPKQGFHRLPDMNQPKAVDITSELADTTSGTQPAGGGAFTAGSAGHKASDALDQGGHQAKPTAKSYVWDTLADSHDAPRVAAGRLHPSQAAGIRRDVADAGGVDTLVGRWWDGDTSAQVLFEPFGGDKLDDTQRRQIADVIETSGAYADNVWDAALFAATRGRGLDKAERERDDANHPR